MSALPDPVWPVVVLALVQLGDAVICLRPLPFVARCLADVGFPRRWWWVLPPLKSAAALGLVAGIWMPWLGLVTTVGLVLYFVVAITMHVRARDLGRNLFVNATGMLVLCVATLLYSFLL
ncbi:DoxX family protein [Desertihabitans aurantiacus]|uniref:DoxX family protein n=1 Tax=Desertihabitans aurantiacus TaxID=2282477 RepID=UPI000DF74D9C|nr:DoxX family protein [Desertihabitans aurantiacus]